MFVYRKKKKEYLVGSHSLLRGYSQLRDWTQVSCIAGGFFTSWATREAQDTGVGSLSLLQQIFQTQELNWGLLHCRRILYQLSYQGSPSLDIRSLLIRYMIWYSLILGLSLNLLDNIIGTQVFNLMKSIISIFFLLLLVPLMSYLKIYCLIQGREDLLPYFKSFSS